MLPRVPIYVWLFRIASQTYSGGEICKPFEVSKSNDVQPNLSP